MAFFLVSCGKDGGTARLVSSSNVKRVFVTSNEYEANLGVDGFDAACNASAAAAGLGGTWRAWVSDSTRDAIDMIEDVGPWYEVDQTTLVFANKAALINGSPVNGILQNEYGSWQSQWIVWTGTAADGRVFNPVTNHCTNWSQNTSFSAIVGQPSNTIGDEWTNIASRLCNDPSRLLCFEQ